ncbi:MAG: hypothetical protein SCH98_13910 [Deferrisomatales bacterium]|nr:hypothetical protein [Deferrisomatales bacterium]
MKPAAERSYTCAHYREEMRLLGLRRRLEQGSPGPEEREELLREIELLERTMAMG